MPSPISGVRAAVFDAYGTLFDVASAAAAARDALGERWQPLAELWRAKQLQYTWLRSLSGHYVDFWRVTGDALDFALEALGIDDAALRARLLASYEVLGRLPRGARRPAPAPRRGAPPRHPLERRPGHAGLGGAQRRAR